MTTPHAPRPRAQRLSSLNRPDSIRVTPPRRRGPPPTRKCCDTPDIQDTDGQKVCMNCGALIAEQNIVSEVTFAETGTGGAMVLGQAVGENQRHARASGPGFRRTGGGGESHQLALTIGNNQISGLLNSLNLQSEAIREQANKIYGLALNEGFIQGRRTRTVAAVCIYLVCRMNKNYTILLMDLAEKIQVNVFALGDTYKELREKLYISEPANVAQVSPVIDVEALIMRFANKLEFGDKTIQVASDAVAILRRMKRDWMVEGRQPAGLCGACLLMAARANNFRRTTREVVFVVRIGDATVGRRMWEFRNTPASKLSIQQFRETGQQAPAMAKPPAIYRAEAQEIRKRQKLARLKEMAMPVPDSDDGEEAEETQESPELRRDKDGFLIPAMPIDPALMPGSNSASSGAESLADMSSVASPTKRKRGRPPKEKIDVVPPSAQELAAEHALESEIESILQDPDTIQTASHVMTEEAHAKAEANAKALAEQLRGQSKINEAEDIQEDEFDDDPEIANCLLSPEEIVIKERIWVTHNEDWLRAQQAKMLKKSLEDAQGGPKKTTRRRKRKNEEEEGPARDAAEGIMRSLQSKSISKNFSKQINYEALTQIYVSPGNTSRESSVASDAGASVAAAAASNTRRRGSTASVISEAESTRPQPVKVGGLPTPAATQAQSQPAKPTADDGFEVVEEIVDEGPAPAAQPAAADEEEDYDEEEEDFEEAIDPMSFADDWEGEEY